MSNDIFEKQFACHLPKCRGMCCVYGESGAPLEDHETEILRDIFAQVKPYMTAAGIAAVARQGAYTTDCDYDKVTPLIGDSEECAYAFSDGSTYYCAIEKAFLKGVITFRKPLSCHLYPIRITRYDDFEAVNYHAWNVCGKALTLGKKKGTPLYVFLKEPLIRKYGADWYAELCVAAKELEIQP